jgi:membrane fusion protein (multidrug efflux system)
VEGNKIAVRIQLDDGSDYAHQGKLAFAGVIVNDTTGTLTLRAVVPNPEGMLMPGMYVQALLPTALAPDALLVPQQSVTRDLTGRASVLVVKDGDVVEKRDVELDRAVGSQWLLKRAESRRARDGGWLSAHQARRQGQARGSGLKAKASARAARRAKLPQAPAAQPASK